MPGSPERMVRLLPSVASRVLTTNLFLDKDTSAFVIIAYYAKGRGNMRARGVPSLLDRIVEDATLYFLIIFTSQIFVISFEIFAAVSDHPVVLRSSVDGERCVGIDPTPSRDVSPTRLRYLRWG
jgi:hypothetical protein